MKRALAVALAVSVAGCSLLRTTRPAAPDRAGDCTTSYSAPHTDYWISFALLAPIAGLGLIALGDSLLSDKNHPFDGDPYKPYLLPFGIAAGAGIPFVISSQVGSSRVDACRHASGMNTEDEEYAQQLAQWQAVVDAHDQEVTRLTDACIAAGPAGALADVRSTGPDLEAYQCKPEAGAFGVRGTGTHTLKATTCTVMDRCANVESGDVLRGLLARLGDGIAHASLGGNYCAQLDTAASGDTAIAVTVADYRQVDAVIGAARAELAADDLVHAVVVRIAVAPDCDRAKIEATLPPLPPKPEPTNPIP